MSVIIETDLGGDPDDFFAISYLVSAGVDIKAIVSVPSHPYQIQILRYMCDRMGLDIPIGGVEIQMDDYSDYTGFWKNVYEKYKCGKYNPKADDVGCEIINTIYEEDPDIEFIVLGPPTNIGAFLHKYHPEHLTRLLMQGGFIGYDCHNDTRAVRLPKFEGKTTVPSFNPNGDPLAVQQILAAGFKELSFVAKNVCHTVLMDGERYKEFVKHWNEIGIYHDEPRKLFMEGLNLYNIQNKEKRFHDPTACVCYLHPEVAQWAHGQLYQASLWDKYKMKQWGFNTEAIGDNIERIATSLDYDALWDYLKTGT